MYQLNITTKKSNLIRTFVLMLIMIVLSLIGTDLKAQEGYINTSLGAFGCVKYSRNFEDLNNLEVAEILKTNPEAYLQFKTAQTSSSIGWIMYLGGTVLYLTTLDMLFAYGWETNSNPALPVVGLVATIAGGVMILVSRNRRVGAVKKYNRDLHLRNKSNEVGLRINTGENGIGLALVF